MRQLTEALFEGLRGAMGEVDDAKIFPGAGPASAGLRA